VDRSRPRFRGEKHGFCHRDLRGVPLRDEWGAPGREYGIPKVRPSLDAWAQGPVAKGLLEKQCLDTDKEKARDGGGASAKKGGLKI